MVDAGLQCWRPAGHTVDRDWAGRSSSCWSKWRPALFIVSAVIARDVMGAAATIGTLAGFGAVIAVVGDASRMERGQIAAGALALGALAALSGWAGVVLRASPWAHVDGGLWRAASTVTCANAAAAVMAALALLALGKLVTRPAPMVRLGAAGLLVGLGATLSRAGIGSFVVGFASPWSVSGLWPVRRWARSPAPSTWSASATASPALAPESPEAPGPRPAPLLRHPRGRGRRYRQPDPTSPRPRIAHHQPGLHRRHRSRATRRSASQPGLPDP